MSRRITSALIGIVVATLLVVGAGTFLLARAATTNRELADLEDQVQRTNDIMPTIGVLLPGTATTTTVPVPVVTTTAAPTTLAPAGPARRQQRQQQRAAEQAAATQTRAQTAATNTQNLRKQLLEALNITGVAEIAVGDGGQVLGQLPDGVAATDLDLAALRAGEVVSGRNGQLLWAAAARPGQARNGATGIIVTILTRDQSGLFGPTLRWFVLSAALSILAAAIVAMLLGRRLARPVHAAVGVTRALAAGDLGARLDVAPATHADDGDELVTLARSINAMADQLERAREQERRFLMSVSHDLRTPLTSIRGYAEAIRDEAGDPSRAAEVILGESQRLERLVTDLLDLARIDADAFSMNLRDADICEIVEGTLDGFAPELADAQLRLTSSMAPGVRANVDVDRLAQVVANLVANAIGFARTTVSVEVGSDGTHAVIVIVDDGPGIDAAAQARVFDRLYQADNQRDRRGNGTGLGLAIVAELTGRMGGQISVDSTVGSGTRFTVRLPLR